MRVGQSHALVDEALLDLASSRLWIDNFVEAPSRRPPALFIRRVESVSEAATPLSGSQAPWGHVELRGDTLLAHIPDDPFAAEAVLRIPYHLDAVRSGGLLLHSSAVRVGSDAILAAGASGAGKTTLATLMVRAGAELMSDEVNAVFPSGEVRGTPFRSDIQAAGTPTRARLRSLLTLRKGEAESIREVDPVEGVRSLMAQAYRCPIEPLSVAEVLARVSSVVAAIGVRELSFRKDPAAAEFVKQWLRGHRVDG